MMEGVNEIKANIKALETDIWRRASNAGDEVAKYLEGYAKQNAPFTDRTGLLRNSILGKSSATESHIHIRLESSRFYAPFVELGTSRAQAYPFLWPAIAENQHKVLDMIREHFR